MNESAPSQGRRNLLVDAMRGFTILAIVYGDGLIGWFDNEFMRMLDHAAWEGISYWDVGQAGFLYLAGIAIMLSRQRNERRGVPRRVIARRAVIRALLLYAIGVLLTRFPGGELTLRPTGVLQTIAIGYLIGFAFQFVKPAVQLAAALLIPLFHDALLFLFPGPQGPFDPDRNIGLVIDRALFGAIDPSGYASLNVIGAAGMVVIGLLSVRMLRDESPSAVRMLAPLAAALVLAFALERLGIPFIKRAWTSSYHFCVIAIIFAHQIVFTLVARITPGRRLCEGFAVVGRHSLVIYVLFLLFGNHVADGVQFVIEPFTHSELLNSIVPPVGAGTLFWLFAWLLDRRRKPAPPALSGSARA